MHNTACGFCLAANSFTSRRTSGWTSQFSPLTAKLERFFAAPNPPGNTNASISSALTVLISLISPRAMRADSISTLRFSPAASSPVRWLTTCICSTLGAMHTASAPARSIASKVMTDSWISAPSYTPHPESTTPIFFIIISLLKNKNRD